MATAIIQSGDYLLDMATGNQTNEFILDTSLLNGPNLLDGELEYADITPYTNQIIYKRGRHRVSDQQNQAGMLSFVMDDNAASGNLNPLYTGGTFYDTVNNVPGLAPLRVVRLSRSGEYLFVGRVASYDYLYQLGYLDQVSVHCNDDQILLAQAILPETVTVEQLSSARLSAILANAAVAWPGTTAITTGTATLGAYTVPEDSNASHYCQRIVDAEQGRLFMSRAGELTFQPRIGTSLLGPSATFSDSGSDIPFNNITIEFDQNNVVNKASVTIEGGTVQTANDTTSQSLYFIQAVSQTNSLLSSNAQALTLADYLLEPDPVPRYTSVGVNFSMLTDPQRATLATIEIGDTIQVTKAMLVGGSIAQNLAVEGIEAVITVSGGHTVTFYTSQQLILFNLVLNDVVYGQMDSTNVLGA